MDGLEVLGLSRSRRNTDFLFPEKRIDRAGFSNIRVSNETDAELCRSFSQGIAKVCQVIRKRCSGEEKEKTTKQRRSYLEKKIFQLQYQQYSSSRVHIESMVLFGGKTIPIT